MLFNSYIYEIVYEQFHWIYLQGDIKLLLVTVNNRLKFEIEIVDDLSCHPIVTIVRVIAIIKLWWLFVLTSVHWSRCVGWLSASVGVCSRRSPRSSLAQRRRVQRRRSADAARFPWRWCCRFRTTPRCRESHLQPSIVIAFLMGMRVTGCLENQEMWWNLGRRAAKSRANVSEFCSSLTVVTLCIPMSLLAFWSLFCL